MGKTVGADRERKECLRQMERSALVAEKSRVDVQTEGLVKADHAFFAADVARLEARAERWAFEQFRGTSRSKDQLLYLLVEGLKDQGILLG